MILFAARPVGAAIAVFRPLSSRMLMMVLMMVVLPVPGPPVMTLTPIFKELTTACFWLSERKIPVDCSVRRIRLSILPAMGFSPASFIMERRLQTFCSAR